MTKFHPPRPRRAAAASLLCLAWGVPAWAEEAPSPSATLDEVIVTAPRTVEPLTVVTDPQNPRQPIPPADGAGYLKNIPGFTVVRKGGSGGDPLLRGLGGSRLNVLLDGTPIQGGCGMRMDPATAYVFPESYDRITVLKGPQSVIHGGGAVAGTVLMDRRTKPFAEPGLRGNASALVGSFDRNDQLIDVTGGAEPGYVRVIGTRSSSGDYEDGNGTRIHSAYDRMSGTAIAGWTPDAKTVVEASVDVSEAESAYADRTMDGVAFDRRDLKLEITREDVAPWLARLNGQVYHNYIDHVMDRFSLRPWTGGATAALNNPDRTNVGGRVEADLVPGPQTLLTLGVEYNDDKREARSLTAAEYLAGVDYESKPRLADMGFKTLGLFGQAHHDLTADSRLIGGYRLNRVKTVDFDGAGRPEDRDTLHNAFGRYEHDLDLGLPVTAYAGLGHTQRAPDFWERTKRFGLGNEKSTQLDVGLLHDAGKWRGSLSAFYARIDDFILLSTTTGKNVDARTMGGEAELAYAFRPNWSVEGTVAYTHGVNVTEDRPLAQMPPLDTTLGVKYDDGTLLGSLLLRAVAAQDRFDQGWGNVVGTDIGPTGGFATLSASGGWRVGEGILVSAGVDNLLDKTYAEHVSRAGTNTLAAAGYEQVVRVNEPGRTFWLKGNVKF